jgi:hypothetical protein
MSSEDYLTQIESAYSRCRGKQSMLSPIDWQLAQSWQDAGIPIHIALRAMEDCCRNFHSSKKPGLINTLRYFDQEVRKQFAGWQESRVGQSAEGAAGEELLEQNEADIAIARCEEITLKFGEAKKTASPELRYALADVVDAVFLIILQIEGNGRTDRTEDQLQDLGKAFELAVIDALPPDERCAMLSAVQSRWPGSHMTTADYNRLIVRDLCQKLNSPKTDAL